MSRTLSFRLRSYRAHGCNVIACCRDRDEFNGPVFWIAKPPCRGRTLAQAPLLPTGHQPPLMKVPCAPRSLQDLPLSPRSYSGLLVSLPVPASSNISFSSAQLRQRASHVSLCYRMCSSDCEGRFARLSVIPLVLPCRAESGRALRVVTPEVIHALAPSHCS